MTPDCEKYSSVIHFVGRAGGYIMLLLFSLLSLYSSVVILKGGRVGTSNLTLLSYLCKVTRNQYQFDTVLPLSDNTTARFYY